jgi:hypothetical protein
MQEKIKTIFVPLLTQLPKVLGEDELVFDEKEFCINEEDWAQRNILQFGQSSKALAQLAETFLDFGNPNNKQDELIFEGHAGYNNLQPTSCEITFWLPDSLGWFDDAFL